MKMQRHLLKYIIVLPVILTNVMFAQKKSKIIDFYSSDCDASCFNDKGIQDIHLEKEDILFVNFNYEDMCGVLFTPKIIKNTGDTLKLEIVRGYKKWSKSGSQFVIENNGNLNCLCAYNLTIKISNIKYIPKIVVLNELFNLPYYGFIDVDFFNELKSKTFDNNSSNLSHEYLSRILNKNKTDEEVLYVLQTLGNDYEFWGNDTAYTFFYPADHISISGNNKVGINQISIHDNKYKGRLPLNAAIGQKISFLLENKDANLTQKNIYYTTNYNDERTVKFQKYYFYNNFNVYCDENDNITRFEFSLKNND